VRLGSAAPTSAPAGGSSKRSPGWRARRLHDQHGLCVRDDAGGACTAGGGGLCFMARGAGWGVGGGAAPSGRHNEGQGVVLQMTLAVPSC